MKDLSISELSSLFRGYTVVDSADLVKAFNSLCSVAGVSPQAVYDEFELLACTLEDPRLNEENMALLQKRILEEQRKSKAVSQSFTPTRTSRMRMFDATMLNSSSFLTPASKKTNSRRSFISSPSPGIKASPASEAFRSRVNKRLRKIVFNELLLPAYSINERTREKDIRVREIGKSQVRQQEFAYYFNDLEADINSKYYNLIYIL